MGGRKLSTSLILTWFHDTYNPYNSKKLRFTPGPEQQYAKHMVI
jgi:hypothetical protein